MSESRMQRRRLRDEAQLYPNKEEEEDVRIQGTAERSHGHVGFMYSRPLCSMLVSRYMGAEAEQCGADVLKWLKKRWMAGTV